VASRVHDLTVTRAVSGIALVIAAFALSSCGWLGHSSKTVSVSVFSVQPGQCFTAPAQVKAQLSNLNRIECTSPHSQESYALVAYTNPNGTTSSTYPGNDLLANFAQGACAQRFSSYVGVDYLDSSLFFTYLLPSARSWEQGDDRNVICFLTTTGSTTLDSSAKGSKQ